MQLHSIHSSLTPFLSMPFASQTKDWTMNASSVARPSTPLPSCSVTWLSTASREWEGPSSVQSALQVGSSYQENSGGGLLGPSCLFHWSLLPTVMAFYRYDFSSIWGKMFDFCVLALLIAATYRLRWAGRLTVRMNKWHFKFSEKFALFHLEDDIHVVFFFPLDVKRSPRLRLPAQSHF